MPTLHLIDANNSQGCPAVMSVIQRSLSAAARGDQLLLLGGQPLENLADQAGINHAHRIAVPFGKAWLGQRRIKHWLRTQSGFDRVRCWSIDTLHAVVFTLSETQKHLSLIHTPTASNLKRLKHIIQNQRYGPTRVHTATHLLRDHLDRVGIRAQVDPTLTKLSEHPPVHPLLKTELRHEWGACAPSQRVVALLSDHPSLFDATDAAAITCLAGASLTDDKGVSQTIVLVMHPGQRNRLRAQRFLADHSGGHRVVQDTRATRPWAILPGCDAALALGRDAGGLSLHWALAGGVPVVTANPGGVSGPPNGSPPLHAARSAAHKDLAHVLHGALSGSKH